MLRNWNARSTLIQESRYLSLEPNSRLAPRAQGRAPSLESLLAMDEEGWRQATRRTALRRSGRRGLLRNALIAAGNSGDPALIPAVRRHASGDDPLLADHAVWALGRLSR